jgi:hypothetical protein
MLGSADRINLQWQFMPHFFTNYLISPDSLILDLFNDSLLTALND